MPPVTHGHCRNYSITRAYTAWQNMRDRCFNPRDDRFHLYGGRGITVCDRWKPPGKGFRNFLQDMGEPPEGMSLDRRDQNGNYSPENCRWATKKEQQRNIRSNVILSFQGRTQCLSAWAEELGLPRTALEHRVRRGWDHTRVLTTPVQQKRKA